MPHHFDNHPGDNYLAYYGGVCPAGGVLPRTDTGMKIAATLGTPMTKDLRDRGLIINERLEEYDGTTAVVRTEHLSADELEFLRWRAERWIKLRHMPAAFAHSPLFLLRNAPKMFAHTFRGSKIRSFLGLEDEREAFQRFQTIRRAERAYL